MAFTMCRSKELLSQLFRFQLHPAWRELGAGKKGRHKIAVAIVYSTDVASQNVLLKGQRKRQARRRRSLKDQAKPWLQHFECKRRPIFDSVMTSLMVRHLQASLRPGQYYAIPQSAVPAQPLQDAVAPRRTPRCLPLAGPATLAHAEQPAVAGEAEAVAAGPPALALGPAPADVAIAEPAAAQVAHAVAAADDPGPDLRRKFFRLLDATAGRAKQAPVHAAGKQRLRKGHLVATLHEAVAVGDDGEMCQVCSSPSAVREPIQVLQPLLSSPADLSKLQVFRTCSTSSAKTFALPNFVHPDGGASLRLLLAAMGQQQSRGIS